MIQHLMLVDDNVIDQKVYRRTVVKSGRVEAYHPFTSARDALDFLHQPDRPEIDVILLDIRMPEMDGFDFLEAAVADFGESFAKIAVVMLTTSASAQDLERAKSFPFVREYILKPLSVEHLDSVEKMLHRTDPEAA